MRNIRQLFIVILAASLLANGALAAFGQGVMAGSQTIVICSPSGVHAIILGANGEPVSVTHNCDDCCLTFTDDATTYFPIVYEAHVFRDIVTYTAENIWKPQSRINVLARAPPC